MERLRSLGIDPNVPKTELLSLLSNQSTDSLLDLRQSFFEELVAKNLGNEGDELVGRRCTKTKSLSVKLSEDICSLVFCLKNNSHIPRSIVKNGKRDKSYLATSRARSQNQAPTSSQLTLTPVNALQAVQDVTKESLLGAL